MHRKVRAVPFSAGKSKRRFFESSEPRCYDRRFYAGVLLLSFLLILASIGFTLYWTVFNTAVTYERPSFDLSSLISKGKPPDPANPCMVVQEHLEATRRRAYHTAYGFISEGLRNNMTYHQFASDADSGRALFGEIEVYRFGTYDIKDAQADVEGHIIYQTGGSSRVRAKLIREGTHWKINLITVIYQ